MTSPRQTRKKIIVILNGISLRKKTFYHRILPPLLKVWDVEVLETRSKNDGITLASRATEKSADIILASGGDGTLNQVVNGVLKGRETERKLPVIGIIPLGSGNDFARTASVTADGRQLETLITSFQPKKVDVGCIRFTTRGKSPDPETNNERYFVNVADIGMGPMVVDKVEQSDRTFGEAGAYYLAILSTFLTYKPMVVNATSPDWQWQGKMRSLAVANGKYYGHGLCIAPDAVLDDRKFQVFICGDVSVLDFIRQTARLKKGKHIRLSEVHYKEGTTIEFRSEKTCLVESDGEILGILPARVTMAERQLDFLLP